MISFEWLFGAALAAAQTAAFPCDKLGDEVLEVYDGFEQAAPPSRGPVEVRKKAVLFGRTAPLIARTFTLVDPAPAGGKTMVFRRYRSGDEILMCTRMRNGALFGAGDETEQFVLRCLDDRDGDGAYEGFTRRVRLVPVKSMSGTMRPAPTFPVDQEASPRLPLARPIALVAKSGLVDPFSPFKPRARSRIVVSRVRGNEVELSFSGRLSSLPDSVEDRMGVLDAETVVKMTMTDGGTVSIAGTRIRFARQGGKLTAAVIEGFGSEPRLLCSGSVAEVDDTFTILGVGRQSIISRASLPPAQ
jgi:hypothetical protein